jgi:hypothetical protein
MQPSEHLKQMLIGEDIPDPRKLLSRVTNEDAALVLPNFPYSLLTNLEHMRFWQDLWLGKMTGAPRPDILHDWREPDASEFPAIRDRFLDGYNEVMALAESGKHSLSSDQKFYEALAQVGIHNAYHIGQIKLIKRVIRLSKQS